MMFHKETPLHQSKCSRFGLLTAVHLRKVAELISTYYSWTCGGSSLARGALTLALRQALGARIEETSLTRLVPYTGLKSDQDRDGIVDLNSQVKLNQVP